MSDVSSDLCLALPYHLVLIDMRLRFEACKCNHAKSLIPELQMTQNILKDKRSTWSSFIFDVVFEVLCGTCGEEIFNFETKKSLPQ